MSDVHPLHPVAGHGKLQATLARALLRGTLPSTLLFHGPRGVGKQRLALWLGQALLCGSPGPGGGCGGCRPCRLALRLEHPDLHWLFPVPRPKGSPSPEKLAALLEEARGEAIARFRSAPLGPALDPEDEGRPRGIYLSAVQALRGEAYRRPSLGSRRLFLISEAQFLVPQEANPEAANALLKLLEEPPPHVVFVLTSSEVGRVLPTIRSRAVPLHVGPLPVTEVERFLEEVAGAAPGQARAAAILGEGSIGRALGFLPGPQGEAGPLERLREEARDLLEAALSGRRGPRLALALTRPPTGARRLLDLLSALEGWLRDLAAAAAGAPDRVIHADRAGWLVEVVEARRVHPADLDRAREAVDRIRILAGGNVNPQLLVAGLLKELTEILCGRPLHA